MAMAILMLEPFAVQCRTARRGTQKKSLGLDISGGPHQIADTLEPKHGIVKIEGNHVDPEVGVSGAGANKRRHRARFSDALLEDLAVLFLVIVKQRFPIHRLVE